MLVRPLSPAHVRFVCLAATLGVFILGLAHPSVASAHENEKQQGAELFTTRGCAHCHGNTGQGSDTGPALRDLRKRLKPEQIEHQIVAGGQAMPAFGDTLTHEQVEDLMKFLRAKKWTPVPPNAVAQAAPPTAP